MKYEGIPQASRFGMTISFCDMEKEKKIALRFVSPSPINTFFAVIPKLEERGISL
jgi:hypothetical protein